MYVESNEVLYACAATPSCVVHMIVLSNVRHSKICRSIQRCMHAVESLGAWFINQYTTSSQVTLIQR